MPRDTSTPEAGCIILVIFALLLIAALLCKFGVIGAALPLTGWIA